MPYMSTLNYLDYFSNSFAVQDQTETLQPDESNANDTYINANAVSTNFGTASVISVGEDSTTVDRYRTLIKFDLSNIPVNARIISATLSLRVAVDRSTNARDYKVWRLLKNWIEGQATWNIYSTGNNWDTAGAGNTASDHDGSIAWATTNFGASEAVGTDKTFALNVTEFTKWINGSYPNYGLLIKAETETNDAYAFDSSSHATEANRPKLTVVWNG